MIVDLSFLEKFTKGNPKKIKRYISMYLQVAPDTFSRMQQNLAEKDWTNLGINAHSLMPQAEYMGIVGMKPLLGKIEEAVATGNTDELEELFEQAIQLHRDSEPVLTARLEQD
ncbi:MAG: Hpt domain-containing protein [Bacteroidota bacterium]